MEGPAITAGHVDAAGRSCCVVSDAIKTELSVMVVVRSSGPVLSNGEGRMLSMPASTVQSVVPSFRRALTRLSSQARSQPGQTHF